MSTPPASRRSSPSPAQLIGVAVILLLVLLGFGQCSSATDNSDTANPVLPNETLAVAPVDSTTVPYANEHESSTRTSEPPLPPMAPPATASPRGSEGSVYYANCAAAQAAGAAPISRDEAGYRSALDRDNDGIACEPYSGNSNLSSSGYGGSSDSAGSGGSTYYANCSAARAAGAAPLHKGDPGYRSGLDRDSDGVACE
jgi:Excalibur calcium-binding domain